ncbi:hypothetical protein Tco_1400700, partial [Tanacetum coccineum]
MNTTQAQQKALDDTLVAPADHLEFGKCNMRLKTDIKPKEATFQVVLDAFALTPFYQAFLITAEVLAIYMQEFWATVSVHKSSIRFTINKKKVSLDVEIFREILKFCPKIPGQKFEDLLLEHDILSFIRDLGHSKEIIYLSDVSVDYLHQPWRAFATIIHKCLSGKETGMDKIHFLFQIENKEAKKTNKMSYPRFTKIIIDYFMSKDQSISRRNKMFWHTARDDTMFTAMRCISRHEDTQVYGTILPKDLTNQAMLESKAYKTYYAFAFGEKTPKPKYVRKKADSDTFPKQKPFQATKGTRLKTKAKVVKSDKNKQPAKMPQAKGLDVLSKVALTEAEQLKLATKRSKTQFHISQASGSGDGTDFESGVPDEQHLKTTGADEGTEQDEDDENDFEDKSDDGKDNDDANDDDDVDDANDDDDNQEGDDTNDDDEETDSDRTESDRIKIPVLNQSTTEYYKDKEENINDEETMDDKEDDEVTKELYDDVNVNLGNEDTDMTNADQALTLLLDTQKADEPIQSSFVSFDFTSKLLNLENPFPFDNEIALLMETSARHAMAVPKITSGFTTTIPPPHLFFNPLPQKATPTPTQTNSEATTSFTSLSFFSYIFKFNDRVTNLEKDLSEIKQVDQYAQALSSIPAIVDRYIDNKLREAIKKAIQAHNLDCRQEAQDEKNAYIELADTSMRAIIKEESTYEAATSLSEFELTKIFIDKMEKNKSYDKADYKRKLYDALIKSYETDKDLFDSYGELFTLKRNMDDKDKDQDPSVGSDRGTKRR